ncbi:hypothetical protein AGMMS50229_09520 [Campylobacterota bacterium]|nr:hypothetical protein AGMMS50229_09520 [Campylobacterota bacterium]
MNKLIFKSRYKTEMIDITSAVNELIVTSGKKSGVVNLFAPHSTCGLFICENHDPNLQRDLLKKLHQFFPGDGQYAHLGGNGDAHMKSSFMGVSVCVPFDNAKLALGEWQGVFIADFDGPRDRSVLVTLLDS